MATYEILKRENLSTMEMFATEMKCSFATNAFVQTIQLQLNVKSTRSIREHRAERQKKK